MLRRAEMDDERAALDAWRGQREESLTAPWGWLSVAGLFWLVEGEQVVCGQPFTLVADEVSHRGSRLRHDKNGDPDEVALNEHAKLIQPPSRKK